MSEQEGASPASAPNEGLGNPSPGLVPRLESFFDFRPGEFVPTFAAVAYFFFLITSYYVLKPIRESLALELGSQRIPALNIFSMFSLVLTNGIYSWMVGGFRREVFIPLITRIFSGCLIFFFLIFGYESPSPIRPEVAMMEKATSIALDVSVNLPFGRIVTDVISKSPEHVFPTGKMGMKDLGYFRVGAIGAYFIWVNLFSLFSVSMFWSFVNDVFTREQGKRLYSYIGFGGLMGGLCGGMITTALVDLLGTAKMFLIAALLLEPTMYCLRLIDRRLSVLNPQKAPAPPSGEKPAESTPPASSALEGLRRTISSTFLIMMACDMFLNTFGSTLYSFQINALMENTIPGRDQRTLYWAQIYNSINALSIVTQLLVTTVVLKMRNQWVGLLLIPLTQFFGSLYLFSFPSLDVAAGVGVVRYALNYSTGRAVRELYFTPLSREDKYQAKGFIDTLVFRAGDGIGSALLLSWFTFFPPWKWIDLGVIFTMFLSCILAVMLGKQFLTLVPTPAAEKQG